MSSTFHEYIARRQERFAAGVDVEKLRLGQQACEIVNVLSDPEIRFAMVPLTEGEYRRSLEIAENIQLTENNAATDMVRDQVQKEAIIFFAAREVTDLSEKFFGDVADVGELTHMDVAHAYDLYLEMTSQISPTQMGMSEEDFQSLKTLLPRISWSELSGPQWYAGQRFLNLIQPLLLTVKSSGSE